MKSLSETPDATSTAKSAPAELSGVASVAKPDVSYAYCARVEAQRDELAAALRSVIPSLETRLTSKSRDVEAWDILAAARAALAKAGGQ